MTVTVCMINYNQENFIQEAIESVLMQECDFSLELLISDDCSTDNSRGIINYIIKNHPKGNLITFIEREENLGLTSNMLKTLKLCKGEYIAICDSDDFWRDKFKLQKEIEFLNNNKDFVVSFHDVNLFDKNSKKINRNYILEAVKRDYNSIELVCGAFLMPVTMCFRNVIKEIPNEIYKVVNWDLFLTSLLGEFGKAKFMKNISPAGYRLHQNNNSGTLTEINKDYQRKVVFYQLLRYYYRKKNKEVSLVFYTKYRQTMLRLIKNKISCISYFDSIKLYFHFMLKSFKYSYWKESVYLTVDVIKFIKNK
ncbi:Glycosyltransferase involved in cell wall bisynthesis [Lutibacter agarilyticus]|uniref:Glycosyltransferase involved in cell wall bisynthesis n=1 Tax=Lutibacter agarilyticus TaxID=1109740 RepID=A0A238YZJ8_9FLAO|nr:glycosyltransferase [Lutibacter agarilyticus]SNR76084.1 Glycosyltransferase involved in cell wall bisynthesis [Lutibacter agarilyticus]